MLTSFLVFINFYLTNFSAAQYFLFELTKIKKKYSALYRLGRFIIIRDSYGPQIQARFKLPDVKKLDEEARSGSLYILFFTPGMHIYACVIQLR